MMHNLKHQFYQTYLFIVAQYEFSSEGVALTKLIQVSMAVFFVR